MKPLLLRRPLSRDECPRPESLLASAMNLETLAVTSAAYSFDDVQAAKLRARLLDFRLSPTYDRSVAVRALNGPMICMAKLHACRKAPGILEVVRSIILSVLLETTKHESNAAAVGRPLT